MPRFENMGHQQGLQRLGLLRADEFELSAGELAQRLINKPQVMDEALYILRQDILQPITVYGMLDATRLSPSWMRKC